MTIIQELLAEKRLKKIQKQMVEESLENNLPLILDELKRANKLKALSIHMGIEERKQEAENKGDEKLKNDLFECDLTLEAIMKGIS